MINSTQTLTQSGLLPVLLQRQRAKVTRWRGVVHAVSVCVPLFGIPHLATASSHGATQAAGRDTVESFIRPIPMSHQIHTYTELRQQIHDDLPIQHPKWVEPNGASLMCLMKLLDSLTQTGIQRVYRSLPSSRLEHGLNRDRVELGLCLSD